MSELEESMRFFKTKPATALDDELFIKQPVFMEPPAATKAADEDEQLDDVPEELEVDASVPPLSNMLFNVFKQPSLQRWIWHEFFESHIDKAILSAQYDIRSFTSACFPQLEANLMPRRAWQQIRRKMGKPRRFSEAFIDSERLTLEHMRHTVRLLQREQYDNATEGTMMETLPANMPHILCENSLVSSFLHKPELGFFYGRILSYQPERCSYQVRFKIAEQTVELNMPDICLDSVLESKNLTLSDAVKPCEIIDLTGSHEVTKSFDLDEIMNKSSFPKELLQSLLRLHKLVDAKGKAVQQLAELCEEYQTCDISKRRDFGRRQPVEQLHNRFVSCMIQLHSLNSDIVEPLNVAHNYNNEYQNKLKLEQRESAQELLSKCRLLAERDFQAANVMQRVEHPNLQQLIMNLQIILYLCGEVRDDNKADIETVLLEFVRDFIAELPAELAKQFQEMIAPLLGPLREYQFGELEEVDQLQGSEQQQQCHLTQDVVQFEELQAINHNSDEVIFVEEFQAMDEEAYASLFNDVS